MRHAGQDDLEDAMDGPWLKIGGRWTTVTTANDPRVTRWGRFWRMTKIDELPQLINVLKGDMSLVGPRPDVPGFADHLEGDDRIVLSVRPGITGPATLKYRKEEEILAGVDNAEAYNREVIFPDKVRLNREYVQNWSFSKDLWYIWRTVSRIAGVKDSDADPLDKRTQPLEGLRALTKRTFDLCISALLIFVFLPVFIVVAGLVWLNLGRPVFFRQMRPGLAGRPFHLIKFRTMRNETEQNGRVLADSERLTTFGRWLRATSLDELPELWNVLKGEMSLVGPRPLLMQYLPLYNDRQAHRHDVRPGITGWAQVNGRNMVTWEEKLELDVWYVENQAFILDLRILWLTFWSVLRRQGISAPGHATAEFFLGSAPDSLMQSASQSEKILLSQATVKPQSSFDLSSTTDNVLDKVTSHLNEVLRVSERPPVQRLDEAMRLRQDLGLDSLELAELTVRLEAEFGVDIFREGLVNTVAEVLDRLNCRQS